jgi:tRNA (cmo5U34)-methyltransferase
MIVRTVNWFHASTISTARRELLPFAPEAGFEVLDLGAGTGLLSAMVAAAFPKARLTLFDLTPEMLMIARVRLKPLGKRVRLVTADFAAAAQSKSYDAVVSTLALFYPTAASVIFSPTSSST